MSDQHTCGYSLSDPGTCAACRQEAMPSSRARQSAYEAMRRSDEGFDAFMRWEGKCPGPAQMWPCALEFGHGGDHERVSE